MRTVTINHIPVLIHDLDDKGMKGATDGAVIKWSSVTMDDRKHIKCSSLRKTIVNTLKAKITPLNQLATSNGRRVVTKVLISHLGITNPYLRRDFIAINVVIHLGAMDKCINLSTGYIKPANSSKWSH